jgi:hypothetical protein
MNSVKASSMQEHIDHYKDKSISLWSETDVIHFLLNLFHSEAKHNIVDYHFLRVSKLDGKQLSNLNGDFSVFIKEIPNQKIVERALREFSFSSSTTASTVSSTSEYATWIEEDSNLGMLGKVLNNQRRSLLTPHHFFKPIPGIERSKCLDLLWLFNLQIP